MFERLKEDVNAVRDRDPAARSFLEVLLLYPGVKAIRMHRRAHFYYTHGLHFLARWVSQRAVRNNRTKTCYRPRYGYRYRRDHRNR